MPESPKNIHQLVLVWHEIVPTSESLCDILKNKFKYKIIEVLQRWKDRKTDEIIWAKKMLRFASEKKNWIQENDLRVFRKFLEKYPTLGKKYKESVFHLNISPYTLLDETYWNKLLVLLWDNSFNREFYKNFLIEITEVEWSFAEEEINRLNEKIKILEEHFWIKTWIDDYPTMSNNYFMLKNIKWIDFVKLDKSIVIPYCKWLKSWEILWDLYEVLKVYVHAIKTYHPNANIILEWIEDADICWYIKEFVPEITHFQWHLFWKPTKIQSAN